jgi:hypothetical protein
MSRFDGMSGHLFEEVVLGRCKGARYCGYLKRHEAIAEVRKNQPAKKSEFLVALEREFERRTGEVAVAMTAVGSALDYMHGADAILEFRGEVITLDVTMNSDKTHAKADIVVHPGDVANPGKLAVRIARVLVSKLERRAYAA